MVESVDTRFLDRRTIEKAYPLVCNMMPGMTPARCAHFVRPQHMPRSLYWPRSVMLNGFAVAGVAVLRRLHGKRLP